MAAPNRVVIEKVVDQWLGRRTVGAAEVRSAAVAAVAAPVAPVAPPLQSFTQLESKPEPRVEKAPRKPVPFVCEDDVRAAITAHSKIIVGNKTIITPSARELAEAHDVFLVE
jgi:hypothetical protein